MENGFGKEPSMPIEILKSRISKSMTTKDIIDKTH